MAGINDVISAAGGLIITSIQLTIPILLLTVFFLFVFNFVQKRTGRKWIGACAITLFAVFLVFFLLVHTLNILNGVSQTDIEQIPPDVRADSAFQSAQANPFVLFFSSILKSILAGGIFALIILPFAFMGVSVFDVLQSRVKDIWPRIILTCWLFSIVLILLLAAFPWIPVSLVYLTFYGV